MNSHDIMTLNLELQAPWEITEQLLDTDKSPHELRLTIQAQRRTRYPCPMCGSLCHAHDFKEMTWRHLDFFQHHCFITAAVPRVRCLEHGVKQIEVPWARKGSKFTLLFEQAAMSVFDLSTLKAFSLDETNSRKGHRYLTVFIDLDRTKKPVVFAVPGKGKQTLKAFKGHLIAHKGKAAQVVEVVSDMSGAFISGVKTHFANSSHTVDWFHVVQLFTNKALDDVRRAEAKEAKLPKATRWATSKRADGPLTEKQIDALAELMSMDLETSKEWRIKEMLRWVRQAPTVRCAKWRLTTLLNVARSLTADVALLKPVRKALRTVEKRREAICDRWISGHNNARIEALNGIFQAAKCRARGYRNDDAFISIIYLLAAPIQNLLKSNWFAEGPKEQGRAALPADVSCRKEFKNHAPCATRI